MKSPAEGTRQVGWKSVILTRKCQLGGNANRGDSRYTNVNENAGLRLLLYFLPQRMEFSGDAVLRRVQPGQYANTRALHKARKID
jgi:hypothetical protein